MYTTSVCGLPLQAPTRLLVYQGKALNVLTVPLFVSKSFWEKKIMKIYKIWTINVKFKSRTKMIWPIWLASLNSIWNYFVVRDNLPLTNNSRYALRNINSPEHGQFGNFQTPPPPRILQKTIGGKISFFIWTAEVDIFYRLFKNVCWKLLFRSAKFDWIKKNHTEQKYSVFFESRNNKTEHCGASTEHTWIIIDYFVTICSVSIKLQNNR